MSETNDNSEFYAECLRCKVGVQFDREPAVAEVCCPQCHRQIVHWDESHGFGVQSDTLVCRNDDRSIRAVSLGFDAALGDLHDALSADKPIAVS